MAETILYFALAAAGIATLISVAAFWLRPDVFERVAKGFIALTALLILSALAIRGYTLERFPLSGLYEFTLSFVVFMALAYYFVQRRLQSTIFTVGIALSCFLGLAIALTTPHSDEPLMPALKSVWLSAHVLTAVIAYGSFGIAAVLSIIYLIKSVQKSHESIALYDELSYKGILIGFVFQTLLLVTGAVWAEEVWGNWWSWDPKETWALITWLVYAAALHGYKSRGWAGRKAAWFSVLGFAVVIFTLLGVTFLLPGMHSYF